MIPSFRDFYKYEKEKFEAYLNSRVYRNDMTSLKGLTSGDGKITWIIHLFRSREDYRKITSKQLKKFLS